ncbi:MAG: ABC transporter ATP-binding protein [Kineosporiaceae bacterium]
MTSAVRIEGVTKRFRVYHERNQSLKAAVMRGRRARFEDFRALQDVSFEIPAGSTFGLMGENGSGKSTLLKCIARILEPDAGRVVVDGSLGALLELGSGFHPELTGRENVYLNGSILGLSRAAIDDRFDEIVDFAGIENFIDQPVKNYSSGMYVRLGFSVAINVEPEVLLVDEVLAVGDSGFQRKCLDKFADYRREGRTVVVVSHAMGTVRTMCDQVAWLEHGRLRAVGPAMALVDDYLDEGNVTHEVMVGGGSREGTGEIHVEDVRIAGADGGPLRSGAPAEVTVWVRAAEPVDDPVVGLGVETREGFVLWGANTKEAGLSLGRVDGGLCVRFRCPALPLQGESFDLLVAATDTTTQHVYDFLRKVVRFDVELPRPAEAGGPVALRGRWEVRPGEPAPAPRFPR